MPAMSPVVEVAFGSLPLATTPQWTDITRYVQLTPPITITRGRSDELSDIQPGTCTLTLDNTDGRFTPSNAAGPYWPNVKKGRRLRVRVLSVDTNYVTHPQFETDTADWSPLGATQTALATSGVRSVAGTKSLLIAWNGSDGLAQGAQTTLYGLDVGQVYTAHLWVWVPPGVPAVQLGVAGLGAGAASVGTDAWVRLEYTFTATSTRHALQVTPTAPPADGQQTWVDQAQVNAGPTRLPFSATPAVLSPRFDGYVNAWPVEWPGGGRVATTAITCTDLLRRLAQPELRSFVEEEIRRSAPLAYYPLSEASSATGAGDTAGAGAGVLARTQAGVGGALAFGSGTGPAADGLSCLLCSPVDATHGVYLAADLGSQVESSSTSRYVVVEAWFATTTGGRLLLNLHSNDFAFELSMSLEDVSGRLRIETVQSGANTSTLWDSDLRDGLAHHVVYDESDGRLWIDGTDRGVGARRLMYRLRHLTVGGYQGDRLWAGSLAHVAVYTADMGAVDAAWVQRHYTAGVSGFDGERGDARVQRIADYIDAPPGTVRVTGAAFDAVATQGAGRRSPLALMQDAAVADAAQLFAARDGGLVLQGRDVRYAPTAALTLDAADLDGPPTYADTDQYLANEIRAARPGGAAVTLTAPDSIADYGRYVRSLSLIKADDDGLRDAGQWLLLRSADPAPRLQSLPVEAFTLGTTTHRAVLGLDISSPVALTNLPAQAPTATDLVVVEGYREQIDRRQHLFDFHTSPAGLDRAWVLDDPASSVLDSTTTLAY